MHSDFKNILLILILVSSQANAVLYKNPVTKTTAGQKSAGVSFVSMSRDLTSDGLRTGAAADQTLLAADITYAVSDQSEFEVRIGLDKAELDVNGASGSSDGILFGALFRSNIPLNNTDLKLGGFGSIQTSSLSDDYSDTSVLVYEFGAGISKTVDKGLDIYGGGVLSFLDGTIEPNLGYSYDFEASDNIGIFAGVEKSLQGQMKVGFELNLIHQTGFAAYIEMPF